MSEVCAPAFTCDDENVSAEQVFKEMILEDESGEPALNTIEVVGTNTLYVNCNNANELTWKRIFFDMIGRDTLGRRALKIIKSNPAT